MSSRWKRKRRKLDEKRERDEMGEGSQSKNVRVCAGTRVEETDDGEANSRRKRRIATGGETDLYYVCSSDVSGGIRT